MFSEIKLFGNNNIKWVNQNASIGIVSQYDLEKWSMMGLVTPYKFGNFKIGTSLCLGILRVVVIDKFGNDLVVIRENPFWQLRVFFYYLRFKLLKAHE